MIAHTSALMSFGDWFSSAFSEHFDETLLFKGADFSLTDLTPAC